MIIKGFNPNQITFFISRCEKRAIMRNATKEELAEIGVEPNLAYGFVERITDSFDETASKVFEELGLTEPTEYFLRKVSARDKEELMELVNITLPNNHQKPIEYQINYFFPESIGDLEYLADELDFPITRVK